MKLEKVFFVLLITSFLISCNTGDYEEKNINKFPYTISKSAISDRAMVVSAHPLASEIGLEILKSGGNAVDAAIAVQFALAVTYPNAGNIGGGGFMMIRLNDKTIDALDFREKAPAAATETMYQDSTGEIISGLSRRGHLAAGVPGSVAGMVAAHKKYGKLPFEQLVEPSIQLATQGFPLTRQQAAGLNRRQEEFKTYNTSVPVFVKDTAWKAGDLLIQKDLAQTLTLVRDNGRAGFYEGTVADLIVQEMEAGEGLITHEDLKNYEAKWRTPIVGNYRGYDIISMPPPSSGGVALVQLLNSIEPYPIREWGFHSRKAIHLMVEAERRVYADRATHLGDMDFYPVPVDDLVTKPYAVSRMSDFDPIHKTLSSAVAAGLAEAPVESEETTHFSIIDEDGNAVSVTTTINGGFGCYTVVSGAGFLLNNEMDDFSSKPGVPNMFGLVGAEANKIEPGKRMLSSMTPTIVVKNDSLKMVVGTPGGSTIITSVFQNIVNVLDFGMTITESVQASRFHHQWLPDVVFIEPQSLPADLENSLKGMGHEIRVRGNIGRVDAILVKKNGQLEGAADPRGDDHVASY